MVSKGESYSLTTPRFTHMAGLTELTVKNLKPRATLHRVADAEGLCVEVHPSAARYWRYRYRYAGKAKMLPIGTYPTVSLKQARLDRDKARDLLRAASTRAYSAGPTRPDDGRPLNPRLKPWPASGSNSSGRILRAPLLRRRDRCLKPWRSLGSARVRYQSLTRQRCCRSCVASRSAAKWKPHIGSSSGARGFSLRHCHRPREPRPVPRSSRRPEVP